MQIIDGVIYLLVHPQRVHVCENVARQVLSILSLLSTCIIIIINIPNICMAMAVPAISVVPPVRIEGLLYQDSRYAN